MIKKIRFSDKIFLAGSSGMVGNAVKKSLEKSGYGMKIHNGQILFPSKKELNLLEENSVNNWFKENKPEVVILAAAKVGGIYANSHYPADFLLENLKIQTNVIQSAWKHNARRLIFLGSSCIYPKFAEQPIKEEYLLNSILEETNQNYAIAKIAGLKLCESLRSQYGFDAITLMPTNLYGPHDNYHPDNSHVIAALIRKFVIAKKENLSKVICWGTGSALREFMHVEDLADAIIFCLENWDPTTINSPKDDSGNPLNHLNVGTGIDISIKDLSYKISKIVGFKGEINWDKSKPDGTPRKLLDVSRIKKLGWTPKIDLDTGIKLTLQQLDFTSLYNF